MTGMGLRLGHSATSAQCPVCPKADLPILELSPSPALRECRHGGVARRRAARALATVFVVLAYRRGGSLYDAADTAPSARPAAHAATANCDNVVETESSLEMLAKVAKRRIRDHFVERMCIGTGQPVLVCALIIRVV